jgi:adenine-specific DNA-methyltransferase
MANDKRKVKSRAAKTVSAEVYRHKEAEILLRPEVGTQSQFKKKKPPKTYKYDSSLSPVLEWDGQNAAREQGEALIREIEECSEKIASASGEELRQLSARLASASAKLKNLSKPFLNWAGKAERLSFDVPTLPLFVHERLSTKAIIETLQGHRRDQQIEFELFGDSKHSITDQVLKAYEYTDEWVNRMILGDSLVVMNSLLQYEGMAGQVQMIYMDPPYGVKFGSNFQPFVRKRDVSHNDDDDMTREPEMVKAYRDTWEVGLHSYLIYMRDRLLLSRDLLSTSGSVFVQIGEENLHHVRELMDEVLGEKNFVAQISFRTTGGRGSGLLDQVLNYLLWYSKDIEMLKGKYRQLHTDMASDTLTNYDWIERPDGTRIQLTAEQLKGKELIPEGRRYQLTDLTSQGETASGRKEFEFEGEKYFPRAGRHWSTTPEGMKALVANGRIQKKGRNVFYRRYMSDYPNRSLDSSWDDTAMGGFLKDEEKFYVVQTPIKVIQRCLLMTTDPGDLVLDPTCGSGTTAYVAEQWGRRWITIDTSRVPLALARQRLLTATFPFYKLKEGEERGPAGGFVYERKQNNKGEEIGGIVPHITLKSIANNEPPAEEVLVDRPEVQNGIIRVTGPFAFEATIPTPVDWEGDGEEDSGTQEPYGSFVERMLEVLRRSPVVHLGGGKTVQFKNVRPPAKTLSLSAEALVANGNGDKPAALVFGPENGAVSEKLVYEAAKEASAKSYSHLYVIGFGVQPNARQLVDNCDQVMGIAATYVQATPDLMMGDLLKNMRSSQIFSVCGLPEIKLTRIKSKKDEPVKYQVELIGLDVFDPITMQTEHRAGDDVPAWFLDIDYNERVFHVSQAFFPRTSAWDNLKKSLKGTYDESVWDHLAGTVSAPFEAGDHGQIAVKVIDDRGNELLVIKKLIEVEK